MLRERREELHERTAGQIETLFNSRLEDHYGDLAHHYRCSINRQKAVEYLQLAAQQAVQRSANMEAINYLTSALEFVKAMLDTPQRAEQELALQTILGPALIATKGNGAVEVRAAYERAVDLARQLEKDDRLFPVLFGLRSCHLVSGELHQARELGERLLSLAERLQDSGLTVEANLAQGHTLSLLGKFATSLAHLNAAVAIYDPQKHHAHAFHYGLDPAVFCLSRASWDIWVLGYPDQAIKKIEQAIALAQEQSHSYSLAVALLNASGVYHACGNEPVAQRHAEAAIALSTEQGFANFLGQATAHLGAALAQQGKEEKGIALIREGIAACRATGALLFQPLFIGKLAEAYEVAKRFEEGLVALAEAFAIVGRTGERYYEAELYRLKGELTLKQSVTHHLKFRPRQVEECFWKAVEIAREQQAKSSELRAVMSLSRLLQRQGKNAAARQMLEEIRDWFSEGFDTQDLKDAAALLKELS